MAARPRRFRFRWPLLVFGGLAAFVALAVFAALGWQRDSRLITRPAPLPSELAPFLLADADLPGARFDAALGYEFRGRPRNASALTFTLSVPAAAELPPAAAGLLGQRYRTFADAYRDARAQGVPTLLSTEALAEKAAAIEEGAFVALERLFVEGEQSAGVPPLAHWLAAVDDALVAVAAQAPPDGEPSAPAVAEARAYLGVSLSFLEEHAPQAHPERVRTLRESFLAARLWSEPAGLWAASPARTREFRALRALTVPLDPAAAAALRDALKFDDGRGGPTLTHYRRWLRVLDRLHGRGLRLPTLESLMRGGVERHVPVSVLPYRWHESPSLWGLAAEHAHDDPQAEGLRASSIEAVKRALGMLVVGDVPLDPSRDASWRHLRMWARAALLPGTGGDGRLPHTEAAKVRAEPSYKLLRLYGVGPALESVPVEGISVLGLDLFGWRQPTAWHNDLPLRVEPSATFLARWQQVAVALPALVAADLDRSALRRAPFVAADGELAGESVLARLNRAAGEFAALYVHHARELGIRADGVVGNWPDDAALTAADAWLDDGFLDDADLSRDVRQRWPLQMTAAGEQLWLGTRGVVWHPVEVAVADTEDRDGGGRRAARDGSETRYFGLVAVPDRLLAVSTGDGPLPRDLWRLLADRAPESLLRALTR